MYIGSWISQQNVGTSLGNRNTSPDLDRFVDNSTSSSKVDSDRGGTMIQENILSLLHRSNVTMMEASAKHKKNDREESTKPSRTITYDFVIIGSGSAGQSALKTLKEKCPSARIAVIDPVRLTTGKESRSVDYYRETATGFNPKLRTVQLMDDASTQLVYRYGILLATGSRGAPPPIELFQVSALPRVFELRTTELAGNSMQRPVLAPEHVRKAILGASSKGAKVAILGSGWDVSQSSSWPSSVQTNYHCFLILVPPLCCGTGARPSMCHFKARSEETNYGVW